MSGRKDHSLHRLSGEHPGPLRIVAFSDYRVHDIGLLAEELSKLRPVPDLALYAGDDIDRFYPQTGENLFEVIASGTRYGLCAVAGNDDPPLARKLIGGKNVFNAHLEPIIIGDYAILGLDGAPVRRDLEGIGYLLHSEPEIAQHLRQQKRAAGQKKIIILSHCPPYGILDQAQRFSVDGNPRSIGSRSLRKFLSTHKSVVAVVCGHVHRLGGQHKAVDRTIVLNTSNHDDYKAVARYTILQLHPSGKAEVEWREIREASIVPGINQLSAERLRTKGIRTVEELAATPIEVLSGVPHLGHRPDILKARAQAIVQSKSILLQAPCLPTGPEHFLDIETDLLQRCIWLIGVSIGRSGAYKGFFAETPDEEKDVLVKFLAFACVDPTANILTLSGSEFEKRVIRDRLAHYDLPVKVCERIVDLHWKLQPSVALPTLSYKVKEVAAYFGYNFKHVDLRGRDAPSLYEEYQRIKHKPSGRKLKQKLLDYNEDDVRCLPYILDGIANLEKSVGPLHSKSSS